MICPYCRKWTAIKSSPDNNTIPGHTFWEDGVYHPHCADEWNELFGEEFDPSA